MRKLLLGLATLFLAACAGTTIIAPEIEIKKDGTVKIAFEATVTKTASTSTTAYHKPGGSHNE